MRPLTLGFGLILLAAVGNGVFPLPLRIRRRYEVENTMMLAMGIATIVVPTIVIHVVLPDWMITLSNAGLPTVITVAALGLAWGFGSVTYGFGIAWLGLSVGFAIIMGIITAVGSMMPLLRRWQTLPWEPRWVITMGVAICVVGVAVCGKAGVMRDRRTVSQTTDARSKFIPGLVLCILSGLLSAGFNLAFDFSEPIGREAAHMGISPLFATLPRWLPIFWGGYAAIFISMLVKMIKGGTYRRYIGPGVGRDFALAISMGVIHFIIVTVYGMATVYLGGQFGTSIGYAVFVSSSIILANALGFLTGEWKDAPASAVRTLYAALAILIVAIIVLSAGTGLLSKEG